MKKIEAIIRSTKFDAVRTALAKIGVKFFTLIEVKGFGLQRGEKLTYRGSTYDADYISRLRLDIITVDEKVDDIVDTVMSSAKTGEVGDGKITILNVENLYRVRNGDKGADAL